MYYFFIGSYEKGGFQNDNLKDSKYIGRVKTKDKYLALLNMLNVSLFDGSNFKFKSDIVFFDEYKNNIIGDLYFIEDKKIVEELDYIEEVKEGYSSKKTIIVKDKNNNEIEVITYFDNTNLKETLELSDGVINEYLKEKKIKTLENVIMMDSARGNQDTSEWVEKLKKVEEDKNQ